MGWSSMCQDRKSVQQSSWNVVVCSGTANGKCASCVFDHRTYFSFQPFPKLVASINHLRGGQGSGYGWLKHQE